MSVVSKNLFDALGNDDGDETPKPPVKTVDKVSTHTVKRNTDGLAPAPKAPASAGNRRGNVSGNEAAYRDRYAGSDRNRTRPTDDSTGDATRGGQGARVRGGRGSRYPRNRDDRHSKSFPSGGSDKQAAKSWGAAEGQSELKDEQAGEAIAHTEQKDTENAGGDGEKAAEPAEPEEKHISYADYLAQLAEKKLALAADSLKVREANEGSTANKKWADAKELVKEGEDYFAGSGGKAKRERERKTKQVVDIDQRYVEPERPRGGGARGGMRGGARGDMRGGARGDMRGGARGDRGFGRGGPRGGGGGGRGGPRGPRGGDQPAVNPEDQAAFPSLGS